ncbi:MAG: hypothetical protein H7328_09615 [Bdellovibrio sp.]|nr:hypothetical protein [Bdellovibrio sp.]
MTFFKLLKNHRGLGIIEIAVGLSVVAILGVSVGALITSTTKKQKVVASDSDLYALREIVFQSLTSSDGFANTIKNPANTAVFSCLNSNSDCRSAGGEFTVFDRSNNPLSLSSLTAQNNTGFNLSGTVCATYNAGGVGDDNCPFKYVATWSAECFNGQNIQGRSSVETACRDPLIKINVTFTSKIIQQANFPFLNAKKMQISLLKSQNDASLADQGKGGLAKMCATIAGGVFDPGTSTCVIPSIAYASCENICGPGRQALVIGFNTDASPKCTCSIASLTNCNSPGTVGQVIRGVTDDGSLICQNGIVPALVSSGNINNTPITFGDGALPLGDGFVFPGGGGGDGFDGG